MKLIDITGRKYGKLTVIKRVGTRNNKPLWECKCDCGNITYCNAGDMKRGHTTSCGCARIENHPIKHGGKKTRLYRIWKDMRQRCNNPNNKHYHLYGGRGIKIDAVWETYPPFRDWALSNGYSDSLSIDRIDNDKGYSPDNCRWATQQEQMNNVSYNRHITFGGETHTVAEWERITGISRDVISYRMKRGWETKRVLTEKPYKGKNQYFVSV